MTDGVSIAAFVVSAAAFAFSTIWQPFATHRAEQARLAFNVKRQYVQDYQPHLDTLHAYRAEHGSNYYRHWQVDVNGVLHHVMKCHGLR